VWLDQGSSAGFFRWHNTGISRDLMSLRAKIAARVKEDFPRENICRLAAPARSNPKRMRDFAEKTVRIRASKRKKSNPLQGGQDDKVCRGAAHDDNRTAPGFRRRTERFFHLVWLWQAYGCPPIEA
jgi:hypothetical protein